MPSKNTPKRAHLNELVNMINFVAQLPPHELYHHYQIPEDRIDTVTQDNFWTPREVNKQVIRATIEGMMEGSLDVHGIQRYSISAELIAAFIAAHVAPVNLMIACALWGTPETQESLMRNEDTKVVSDSTLFALASAIQAGEPQTCEKVRNAVRAWLENEPEAKE